MVAFAAVGTTVPIESWITTVLTVTGCFVVILIGWSIWEATRLGRVVAGVAAVLWWGLLALSLVPEFGDGRVSLFGLTTFMCIPVLIGFTYGLAWGRHDLAWGRHDIDERNAR